MTERDKTEKLKSEVRVTAERLTGWPLALNCARATRGNRAVGKEPSEAFKRMALTCEHSPIRAMMWRISVENVPYFAAMHLVRHKVGCEWFVSSQRSDLTGADRGVKPQDSPVSLTLVANAAALLCISRERLCSRADAATRTVWSEVCRKVGEIDRFLGDYLAPKCVRLGFCPEDGGCGLIDHPATVKKREMLYGKPSEK